MNDDSALHAESTPDRTDRPPSARAPSWWHRADRHALTEALAHIGTWDWDIVQDVVWWSDELYRIFGLDPEIDILLDFRFYIDHVYPDDRPNVTHRVQQALRGELPFELEHRLVRPDGSLRTVACRGEVTFDNSGRPLRLFGTAQDVTKTREFERELARREEEFRRIIETAHEGVWLIDADSRTVIANQAMGEMLGCSPEKLVGVSMYAFIDPEKRSVASRNVDRRRAGIAERHEFVLRRSDGKEVATEMAASPLFDADGRYQGALAMVTDVSERKQIELERERLLDAFATERDWLSAVIDQSSAGIALVEKTHPDTVRLNAAAAHLLGFAHDYREVDLRNLKEIEFKLDGEILNLDTLRDAVFMGMRMASREVTVRKTDGQTIIALLSIAPVRSAERNLVGAVAVLEDVSELKRLQVLREEWTSIIAHDLRQPLTSLLSNVELLQEILRSRGEPPERHLEQAVISAHQLNRLIGDLTDASLVEAKQLRLEKRPVAVAPLLRAIVERSHVADVVLEIQDALPDVWMDAGRIEQVLINLLSNAQKYGEPDAPIVLRAGIDGEQLRINVLNQGPGIAPEDISHVFDRYARAGRPKGVAGLGLGLYISKGIVEAHQGTIACRSTPGKTTVFTFTIPISGN